MLHNRGGGNLPTVTVFQVPRIVVAAAPVLDFERSALLKQCTVCLVAVFICVCLLALDTGEHIISQSLARHHDELPTFSEQ